MLGTKLNVQKNLLIEGIMLELTSDSLTLQKTKGVEGGQ